MSRPRKYGQRVTTAVRVPAALHDAYHAEAAARDVSVNYLVLRAMEHYLDVLDGPARTAPPIRYDPAQRRFIDTLGRLGASSEVVVAAALDLP